MHKWLKWLAIGFIIYVVAVGKFDAQKMLHETRTPEKTTAIPAQNEPEESNPILRSLPPGEGSVLERYANKYAESLVDPKLEKRLKESDVKRPAIETLSHQLLSKQLMNAPESYGEIRKGTGKPVYCGQEVTVHYLSKLFDGTVIEDTRKQGKPVTFTTGQVKNVLPGLSIGVVGMKNGGQRKIFIAAPMAYDAEGFANKKVPPGTVVQVDAELIDMADNPFDIEKIQAFPKQAGEGNTTLNCLDVASVQLIVRGVDNKVLLETRPSGKPFMFEIGQGDTPFGLEQSVIGMKQGETKTLIIPPDMLKNQRGGTLKDIALFKDLPDDQILIFEVEVTRIFKHFQ